MSGFLDDLIGSGVALLHPRAIPIGPMPTVPLPLSDDYVAELYERLREDDNARAALRSIALNGEFVLWMSVQPTESDYPIEVRRWDEDISVMTASPDPMFNVAGLMWRKPR